MQCEREGVGCETMGEKTEKLGRGLLFCVVERARLWKERQVNGRFLLALCGQWALRGGPRIGCACQFNVRGWPPLTAQLLFGPFLRLLSGKEGKFMSILDRLSHATFRVPD